MDYVIVKYLHMIGILVLFASLVLEHSLLRPEVSAATIKKLAIVDGIYGFSALIVMLAGLMLWFQVGKGSAFYTPNHIFHLKVGLFALVGLASIYPTAFFLKHRKTQAESIAIPKAIIMIVRCEMLAILVLPLFAVMMAQGLGLPH
ncbi:DUF2214 family protein [Undibacterium cyanobacteriorum]|uniref:DUF2214 family protein n=1 Tax=Undibacterium cyanobacteriorum TaxID=3073561 RepID=A0ABY9RHA3_9BURK|nr:DUF2214 family protein [Undibacterium sp. 20NA77.5]WMW80609.1 DUF2214 family protein [Undibacterium sp. 20NA77.5]